MTLAKHKRIQLIWVSGHTGIAGTQTADLLANQGLRHHPYDLNLLVVSMVEL
jgi:ribonuclease HI